MSLAILIFARVFSEKGKAIFLWCSAFQVFRQCGGVQCGLGFAKTIFWGKGFGKTETNLFFGFCPRGGGVWGGIRAGFLIFFGGYKFL
jgi:hypothetical protein